MSHAARAVTPTRSVVVVGTQSRPSARRRQPLQHRVAFPATPSSARAARTVTRASASPEETKILKETTTRLRECAKRGAAASAVDLLVGLGRDGVTPDAFATTACITACVNGKNMELAQKVYDEIFEKEVCDPDEVAVAELARGYLGLDPPGWGRAMQLVNGARAKYDYDLTSVTYNVLLSACAVTNDLARAEEIVDRMVDEEVVADMFTLRAVEKRRSIRAYVKKMLG
jgi:pentatricopeptide repeat protein